MGPKGSVGSASLTLLQPCSLLAQLPGAVTQRGRFLPVPRYLRNFFFPFYNTPTDTKAESGCWGSEACAQAAASHSFFAALQSLVCLHPSVAPVLSQSTGERKLTQTRIRALCKAGSSRGEAGRSWSQSCLVTETLHSTLRLLGSQQTRKK